MTMDQHTPGKVHWEIHDVIYPDGYIDRLVQEGGRVILRHASIRPMEPEDRRRIAACWNACEEAGIPTEALEAGVVREMVEAITEIVDHCNWQDEHHPDGRAVVHKLHYSIADNLRHILTKVRGEADA